MTRPKGFVYGVTLAVGLTLGCAGSVADAK